MRLAVGPVVGLLRVLLTKSPAKRARCVRLVAALAAGLLLLAACNTGERVVERVVVRVTATPTVGTATVAPTIARIPTAGSGLAPLTTATPRPRRTAAPPVLFPTARPTVDTSPVFPATPTITPVPTFTATPMATPEPTATATPTPAPPPAPTEAPRELSEHLIVFQRDQGRDLNILQMGGDGEGQAEVTN
ncbi:MAG: hypothetical protein QF719_11640, partial [Chloroflexota bacterium]|nr:hypothetical protein [Chloroflexota bacterium]